MHSGWHTSQINQITPLSIKAVSAGFALALSRFASKQKLVASGGLRSDARHELLVNEPSRRPWRRTYTPPNSTRTVTIRGGTIGTVHPFVTGVDLLLTGSDGWSFVFTQCPCSKRKGQSKIKIKIKQGLLGGNASIRYGNQQWSQRKLTVGERRGES